MNISIPFLRRSTADRGHAIYRKKVRPREYPEHKGEFAVIDVRSGDYEVDADDMAAAKRLRARRPDARIWMELIGYRAIAAVGGGRIPEDDD